MSVGQPKLSCRIFRLNLSLAIPITEPGTMLEIAVVAYNEKNARDLAAAHHGIEGPEYWTTKVLSDCVVIGHPISSFSYPQVLAKYIQTPYRINDETGEGTLCSVDDRAGRAIAEQASDQRDIADCPI